jgi:hypothetical protein
MAQPGSASGGPAGASIEDDQNPFSDSINKDLFMIVEGQRGRAIAQLDQ